MKSRVPCPLCTATATRPLEADTRQHYRTCPRCRLAHLAGSRLPARPGGNVALFYKPAGTAPAAPV